MTAFSKTANQFLEIIQMQVEDSETSGLKMILSVHLPLENPLGGCTSQFAGHLHHLIEFGKRDRSAQARSWLGFCNWDFAILYLGSIEL